jgi:hypothetical protein
MKRREHTHRPARPGAGSSGRRQWKGRRHSRGRRSVQPRPPGSRRACQRAERAAGEQGQARSNTRAKAPGAARGPAHSAGPRKGAARPANAPGCEKRGGRRPAPACGRRTQDEAEGPGWKPGRGEAGHPFLPGHAKGGQELGRRGQSGPHGQYAREGSARAGAAVEGRPAPGGGLLAPPGTGQQGISPRGWPAPAPPRARAFGGEQRRGERRRHHGGCVAQWFTRVRAQQGRPRGAQGCAPRRPR